MKVHKAHEMLWSNRILTLKIINDLKGLRHEEFFTFLNDEQIIANNTFSFRDQYPVGARWHSG